MGLHSRKLYDLGTDGLVFLVLRSRNARVIYNLRECREPRESEPDDEFPVKRSANTMTLTFPSAISMSSNPQSRCGPSFRWLPSPNTLAAQPPTTPSCAMSPTLRSSTVSEQQAGRNERLRSPTSSRARAITVAAWLTSKIRLCVPEKRRCTSGTKIERKPAMRSCKPSTSSPLRDEYHSDDHESSTSGKWPLRAFADDGRGWRPVPGSTGEYHSDMPV